MKKLSPDRILIVVKETAGDVFVSTGVLPAIKKKWPKANLYFATQKKYFDILKSNPYIKKVIEYHDSMMNYRNFETWGPQKNTFDIVYLPTVPLQICPSWIHAGFGKYIGYVYAHGCDLDTTEYGPQFLSIEKDANIKLPNEYVTFHATTNQDPKDFDYMQSVVNKTSNISKVQIGGKNDLQLHGIDLDLRGKTTPQTLAWVLKNAKLHVGLDSFPMHVSVYVDTPSVIMFGGTYASQGLYPLKPHLVTVLEPDDRLLCSTSCHLISCAMKERGLDKCINNITSDQIVQAISDKIGPQYVEPQEEINLSAYIIIRDGIKYGFPFRDCIESAASIVDEVVIVDGGSTDGTIESLELLKQRVKNLKVFKTKWDLDNPCLFGDEKTHARRFCEGNWLIQLDADEIMHEPYPGAIKDLIRKHIDAKVLDLPVINFYGDDQTIRVEPVSYKWRITQNDPNIVHGVHGNARQVDENGQITYSKQKSDSCEFIDADTLKIYKHKPVFDLQYEIKHQTVLQNRNDKNAINDYVSYLKDMIKNQCLVFHYSWYDLDRKLSNGEFWDSTYFGKRQSTHNMSSDVQNRVENNKSGEGEILIKVDFDHPLKANNF